MNRAFFAPILRFFLNVKVEADHLMETFLVLTKAFVLVHLELQHFEVVCFLLNLLLDIDIHFV